MKPTPSNHESDAENSLLLLTNFIQILVHFQLDLNVLDPPIKILLIQIPAFDTWRFYIYDPFIIK